jgi:MFS transporter, PAT family, beta-lactamase induction signal transducer AmpG
MFLYNALPVFMRQQGVSLQVIGLLYLIAIPIVFKFLWAPIIDRYSFFTWGHYKSWIIVLQLLVALTSITCGFLDIQQNLTMLILLTSLMLFFASTQDIATDALAISLLNEKERGFGNSIQTAGNAFGAIFGGGGVLLLLDKIGWKNSMLTIAGVMLLSLVPLLFHQEAKKTINKKKSLSSSYFQPFIDFCRRPRMMSWLAIVLLYTSGVSMADTMFQPLLVDIGFSLTEIAWLKGVVSYSAGIVGAIIAGFLIKLWGRKPSLIIFGILQALAIAMLIFPALGFHNLPIIYTITISLQMSFSMAVTSLYTIMMDKTNTETAGAEYSFQISILYFGGIFLGVFSGLIAEKISYGGLFAVASIITLLVTAIITKNSLSEHS